MFPQETIGKARKDPRIRKQWLLTILMMRILMKDIQEKSFASTTVLVDIPWINKKSKHSDNNKRFTKHEVNVTVQKQVKKAQKKKKGSILRRNMFLRKRVFLIITKNPLVAAPAKQTKFKN